jgi:hypothetical protein
LPDLGEEEIISRNNETIKSPAMAAPANISDFLLLSDGIRVKRGKTGSSDSRLFLKPVVSICYYQRNVIGSVFPFVASRSWAAAGMSKSRASAERNTPCSRAASASRLP